MISFYKISFWCYVVQVIVLLIEAWPLSATPRLGVAPYFGRVTVRRDLFVRPHHGGAVCSVSPLFGETPFLALPRQGGVPYFGHTTLEWGPLFSYTMMGRSPFVVGHSVEAVLIIQTRAFSVQLLVFFNTKFSKKDIVRINLIKKLRNFSKRMQNVGVSILIQ